MKLLKSLFIVLSILSFVSCASTEVSNESSEKSENILRENKNVIENDNIEDKNFSTNLKNITLEFNGAVPSGTTNTAFTTPISVIVKNSDSEPIENFSVTFSYPQSKENNTIVYELKEVVTGANGIANFMPEKYDFSFNDYITIYPTPVNLKEKNIKAAKEKSIKSEFKVKSDFYKKGILLYIYEYDERDKPKNNFYPILGEIRNLGGRNVGNAPINDAKSINDSPAKIIELIRSFAYINADKYDYLIVGSVKFTQPTTKTENGYTSSMIADIYTVSIKTGEILYKETTEVTGFGKNWGLDQTDCKNKIGKKVVNDLLYSLK